MTKKSNKLSHIPGPPAWPLIGQSWSFLSDPYALSEKLFAQYGPVLKVRVFGMDWVVLEGPDALQAVLMDPNDIFSAKEGLVAFKEMFSGGLLQRDFADHRKHRRVLQAAFKAPVMKNYLTQMNVETSEFVGSLNPGEKIRVYPEMKKFTLSMGARVFMGLDDPAQIETMNRAFIDEVNGTVGLIRKPLPFTAMRRAVKSRALLSDTFRKLIPERRAAGGDDFFSQLCQISDEDVALTDEEIVDHFNFLIMAAHDATTSTLTTMLWRVARDPALQEKVRAEVAALDDGPLQYDALNQLPLIERVLKETLRLTPPVPFTSRATVTDFDWQGVTIPAGTLVVICPGPVMLSPELWSNPTSFDPDRFLPDRAEDQSHKFAWSPFGGGSHKCIGMHFGTMQVKSVITEILRNFRLTLAPEDEPNWKFIPIAKPGNGLPVRLHRL